MTIKEYAKKAGISYEAARRYINRHREELDGYLYKNGKTQHISEDGVAVLEKIRAVSPVVIQNIEAAEEMERLRHENERLHNVVELLQRELLQEKDRVALIQQEQIKLLTQKEETPEKGGFWGFWKRRG